MITRSRAIACRLRPRNNHVACTRNDRSCDFRFCLHRLPPSGLRSPFRNSLHGLLCIAYPTVHPMILCNLAIWTITQMGSCRAVEGGWWRGPARQARNPYPPARLRRAANDERRYRGPAARMRTAQSPRYRRTRPADPWAGISSIRMKGLPLQREGSEHSDDTSGAKDRRSVRERYLGSFPKHRTP